MSLSWRDEIAIFVAPHRVLVTRKRGNATENFSAPVADGGGEQLHAIQTLAALLTREHCKQARASVVVSDYWARYALVPWIDAIRSPAERSAYAKHLFAAAYGDAAGEGEVIVEDVPPGRTALACALPAKFLQELRALCRAHKLVLRSMQPQLIASLNCWAGKLPSEDAWFVTLEEGALAAARLTAKGWARVHVTRLGADWSVELRRLQKFAQVLSVTPEAARVFVDAPARLHREHAARDEWLEWLDGEMTSDGDCLSGLHVLRRGELCAVPS